MIDRVSVLGESRQVQPLKRLQQGLTGRPPRRPLGIARIQSSQGVLLLSQLLPHLVFQQTEHTQPQREQAQQACHAWLRGQVQRRYRQGAPFQAPEAAFDQIFVAVGQHGLLQGQLLGRLIGDVDMPAQTERGLRDSLGLDLYLQADLPLAPVAPPSSPPPPPPPSPSPPPLAPP